MDNQFVLMHQNWCRFASEVVSLVSDVQLQPHIFDVRHVSFNGSRLEPTGQSWTDYRYPS
jgi:hypothetical protein